MEKVVECYEGSIVDSSTFQEDCTFEVFTELAKEYKLILATNGMVKIQGKRIEKLKPYVYKQYISEAMGVIKLTKEYYEYILNDLRCTPEECLMIGDSITNDIIGAKGVGMDVCYYNQKHKEMRPDIVCDYVIDSIDKLRNLLLKEA